MSTGYLSDIVSDAIKLACYDKGETQVSIRFEPRMARVMELDEFLHCRLLDAVNRVSHGCVYMYGLEVAERNASLAALRRGEIELSINPRSNKFNVKYVKQACQAIVSILEQP